MTYAVPFEEFPPHATGKGLFPMQSGFALVINGDQQQLLDVDGAIVELSVCGPGMVCGEIRISGRSREQTWSAFAPAEPGILHDGP